MNDTTSITPIARRGLMLVLSSPSGAGKTTLSRRLLANDNDIELSVSVTTRPPRSGERDGVDYNFVSQQEFDDMRDQDALLEWAKVFDKFYGTPRGPVETALRAGRDILFDIDWQGTQQLAERMRDDLVRIFILPPTAGELEARLKTRAQDPPDVVANRMAKASDEISHWAEYDYVLINDELEHCDQSIAAILHAERLKRFRRAGLSGFVRELQGDL